jgi:hypothetical protein
VGVDYPGKGIRPASPEKVELEDFLKLEHLVVMAKAKALAAGHG